MIALTSANTLRYRFRKAVFVQLGAALLPQFPVDEADGAGDVLVGEVAEDLGEELGWQLHQGHRLHLGAR